MFVPSPNAVQLEKARRILDPIQSDLIRAHVTLCREDEISEQQLLDLAERIKQCNGPITLRFGEPEQFSRHGILITCIEGLDEFHALRQIVLGRSEVRWQTPHITLAHPRNPKSPSNHLNAAKQLVSGLTISFDIFVLVQQNGAEPWAVLREYNLPWPMKRDV